MNERGRRQHIQKYSVRKDIHQHPETIQQLEEVIGITTICKRRQGGCCSLVAKIFPFQRLFVHNNTGENGWKGEGGGEGVPIPVEMENNNF